MPYIAAPSPRIASTGRSGQASFTPMAQPRPHPNAQPRWPKQSADRPSTPSRSNIVFVVVTASSTTATFWGKPRAIVDMSVFGVIGPLAALQLDLAEQLFAPLPMKLFARDSPLCNCSALLFAKLLADDLCELAEPNLCIAEETDFHRIVLANLISVFIQMDDANVLRYRPRRFVVNVLPKQVHAGNQQDVKLLKRLPNFRRPMRNNLSVKRMIGRKAEPAVRMIWLRVNRRTKRLGQCDQLCHCIAFDNPAADEDRWIPCGRRELRLLCARPHSADGCARRPA